MNCPKYKKDLDGGIVEKKRPKGMFVIELNLNLATSTKSQFLTCIVHAFAISIVISIWETWIHTTH